MTTTPNTFRRSSERQVKDPNELYAVEDDRRRNRSMLEFEAIGVSVASHSVLVEPLDLSDSWERRVDFMEAEDDSSFDTDGVVR
jgi:hypothetical protein